MLKTLLVTLTLALSALASQAQEAARGAPWHHSGTPGIEYHLSGERLVGSKGYLHRITFRSANPYDWRIIVWLDGNESYKQVGFITGPSFMYEGNPQVTFTQAANDPRVHWEYTIESVKQPR